MNPADLSKAILEVHDLKGFEELPHAMLRAAARLLDFDAAAYNEFDSQRDEVRIINTLGDLALDLVPAFNAHLDEHPTYQAVKKTKMELTPVRWSDYVTLREFKQCGLYQEYFGKVGMNHQLAIALAYSPRLIVTLSFNRQNRDFTEADCSKLNLLAPHLEHAFRLQKERFELQQAVRLHKAAAGIEAIAVVDGGGRYVVADNHVHALLSGYFHDTGNPLLPAPLRRWLLDANARQVPFQAFGPRGELRVLPPRPIPFRLVAEIAISDGALGDQWLLRFLELTDAECVEKLRALGLTHREAQVLRWIGEGKRNAEIATILGMSQRTVEKHCERIMEKLGLENRVAASALAARLL